MPETCPSLDELAGRLASIERRLRQANLDRGEQLRLELELVRARIQLRRLARAEPAPEVGPHA